MSLQITDSQLDTNELKYYEDVYTSEDNIVVDGKQLPSFTIVDNTYYGGDDEEYRVNARIGCKLGNTEGMKQFISVTDKVLNPMVFQENILWTYERIASFPTVASCKEYIETYINEDVTQLILDEQVKMNQA